MGKFKKILILISVVSILGCSQTPFTPVLYKTTVEPDSSASGGREYYPNNDGYKWVYNVFLSVQGSATSLRNNLVLTGTSTVNGKEVQILRIDNNLSGLSTLRLVSIDNDKVVDYGTTSQLSTEESVLLSFPIKAGKSWNVSSKESASVITQEDITVSAGTFLNCFKVFYSFSDRYGYRWYAKNVGIVKRSDDFNDGTSVIWELASKNF